MTGCGRVGVDGIEGGEVSVAGKVSAVLALSLVFEGERVVIRRKLALEDFWVKTKESTLQW